MFLQKLIVINGIVLVHVSGDDLDWRSRHPFVLERIPSFTYMYTQTEDVMSVSCDRVCLHAILAIISH